LKHSAATKVKVEMTINADGCEVRVADNGRGFEIPVSQANVPPGGGQGGNGLKNMRQRLMDIGGECLFSSQPGNGATVTMCIRLNQKVQKKP
jgi:signal transduction histidine kinase